ncbi:MAG: type II toxin-antitoxin system prevent-host-death family antitoxin [Symploca sp. SIO1B1]|nr:type II toxin-antitoxin system prevent-host-death family antitoxin [Symploca sp. SIO2D2]NER24718.1 type II toxin-antitoxin system prevent-host-death family antitoxin [Symploca sp. SIO1C2]NER97076.1 type II toxin-antitoxin system prevent-host-death family antitoxin [Symploca sp. SIO1B1]
MLAIEQSYSYTNAKECLPSLLDRVTDNNEVVVITRTNKPDVALIAKDELSSLLETVYLLKSPANAQRLLTALSESKQEDKQPALTQTVDGLLEELGIEQKEKAQ